MIGSGLLLVVTLALPLAMAAACMRAAFRERASYWLPLAPLPGLLAAFLDRADGIVIAPPPLRLTLALDDVGAMLLGGAALLWSAAGFYASISMGGRAVAGRFAVWWLLTLTGSLGVFLVADLTSFYLAFSLVSLAAYGLVSSENTARARRASVVYMVLALVGEALILLGFVMLATAMPGGNPLIRDAVAALPGSRFESPAIILLIAGFGLKMGLIPLHVWMPLAHPVAPMPASAALSGIIVKAGVIGLIRFLPLETPLSGLGTGLMLLGLLTAFYAVIVGVTQQYPKTVLAYSTVSQMGVVAALLGAGLATGTPGTAALAAFFALHHLLVKGALFLGVGIVEATGTRRLSRVFVPMALLALSLAGLPFTSGALAKFATKPLFEGGFALAATLTGATSALLMLHFLSRLRLLANDEPEASPAPGLCPAWALVAVASLIVPWWLFPLVTSYHLWDAVSAKALWEASWPVAVGAVLWLLVKRNEARLPRIPEGDVIVLLEKLGPFAIRLGNAFDRAGLLLQRWPVGICILLSMAIALGAALQFGR